MGTPNPRPPALDGLYRPNVYDGPAWYQREIEIPAAWRGRQVTLFLERAHWRTRVRLDERDLGTQDSLISPHVYDLGANLAPGRHRLTICVDNTKFIDLGRFTSINYEGTQTNWNGLIGRIELRAQDPVSISDVQVYPDAARKLAKVKITIANATGQPAAGSLTLAAALRGGGAKVPARRIPFKTSGASTVVSAELPMGDGVRFWDEFHPSLYDLTVSLAAKRFTDTRTVAFGMRDFAAHGTQFTINGRTVFLRGTLECGIFPRTGYPPTDIPSWQRIYRILKSYGLNYIRFHSWCPPEAAFAAADEEGIMIQAEGPQANIQAGRDPARDAFMEQELRRIVDTYGNHPSFILMTLGNEYGGPDAVLSRWVDMLIKADPRHLYSSASAAQVTANRQFTETHRPRGVQGPGTDADFAQAIRRQDRPLVGHEIGQWTFYPNFDEIGKYTGVLQAKNFELVRDDLARKHMLDLAPQFVQATGRHAALLYKEEIELFLRTPHHAGFSLLDLHDYPGQGTALIGILDPFWDSKGFVSPEEHRRYCGATVPLLRMPKRTYTTGETFTGQAEIAHFGPRDLESAQPLWTIRDEAGRTVASGSLPGLRVPTGALTQLGEFRAPLASVPAPAKLTVAISLRGTEFTNQWDIWVYPPQDNLTPPAGVLVTAQWSQAKTALAEGRKVLLLPDAINPATSLPGKFLPVFWSPIWFPKQQPNTMGILCDPMHPALAQFPTAFYSDWQWWELLQNSRTVVLDDAPPQYRPVVGVIDNFARNHRLGNLMEARVGEGKLLLCTINLEKLKESRPAARQLLKSLYSYVGSDRFQPAQKLDASLLDRWLSEPGR